MDKPPVYTRTSDLLTLIQPPLLLSVAAECLAGGTVAGLSLASYQPWLLALAAVLVVGAGAAHSAYFDRHEDLERFPDRPLPARRLDAEWVWRGGLLALGLGILAALGTGPREMVTAIGLAAVVLLHASVTKGIWGVGFLTTALARGMVFVLGLSGDAHGIARHAPAALPILLYAAGWAVLRAARQPGAPPPTGFVAVMHLLAGIAILLYQILARVYYRVDATVFFLPLLPLALPRLVSVMADPRRPAAAEAVQYAFIGLTLVDATLAGGYAGMLAGFVVALCAFGVLVLLRRWPIALMFWPR